MNIQCNVTNSYPFCAEENVSANISETGFCELPDLFDPQSAHALLDDIKKTRVFDQTLFLLENEWYAGNKSHKHTNPGTGNNLLEKLQEKLAFVESNSKFSHLLSELLGPGYRIYLKKLVCRLPSIALPAWVMDFIRYNPANTLGAFIKPEYRDISYYYDVDVHQDIIEWPRQPASAKEHRLLYLYIHLGNVTADNSPLCFFTGTHRYGATPYQHDIKWLGDSAEWLYRDPLTGRSMSTTLFPLLGDAGHAAIWHPCLLHGSHPAKTAVPRLAMRYVLARDPNIASCLLDDINAKIDGLPYLEENYNPGATANPDGSYTLVHNDFTRLGRMRQFSDG